MSPAAALSLSQNQDWILSQNTDAVNGAAAPVWLRGELPEADGRHEAVLFIKPELTALGEATLKPVFKLIDETLQKFSVEVEDIGVLSWKYLANHNIAGDHYGVINKISREGMLALSESARQRLRQSFHVPSRVPEENVMGAHQFLKNFPEFTPETLGDLWEGQNASHTQKLAPGTYAQEVTHNGQNYVILSGFHPQQLLQFTAPGRTIIVMPVRSNTPWKVLRDEMIGDTDPANAPAESLRGMFLTQKDALGIPQVSKGLNGLHLSAGPLEGMVELARFLSNRASGHRLDYTKTNFGAAWIRAGANAQELRDMAQNPTLMLGARAISAFDASELTDMSQAITMLRGAGRAAA